MKLQLALDMHDITEAVEVLKETSQYIDIIEIGTPLIISEGLNALKIVKNNYPDMKILFDAKIMDAGKYEADLAFDSGADIITVLAVADDKTIQAVIKSARAHGKEVMADMIDVVNLKEKAIHLNNMGVDYICIHTAVDVYSNDNSISRHKELATLHGVINNNKLAVAGGIELKRISQICSYYPGIVIVGSYITKSPQMLKATKEIRNAMNECRLINACNHDKDMESIIEKIVEQIVSRLMKDGTLKNNFNNNER